jgi:MFS family permease
VLALIAFCVMLGFGVVAPIIPVYASTFGVSEFAASAVISAFALMRLVASPFLGRVVDKLGPRTVLAIGMGIVAVSSALAGLSQSYLQLLLLRGIGGVGSAMFSISAMTLLLGAVGPELRGRASAFFNSGFLIGSISGPALGGVFSAISMSAPFFFYAGTLALAGIVGLALLSKPKPTTAGDDEAAPTQALRDVVRDRRFQAACLINLANGWSASGMRSAMLPLFVAATMYSIPAEAARWTGIAMACSALLQAVVINPAGAAVDRFGRRLPMIAGSLLAAASVMAIPFTSSIIPLIVVLCFNAVATAILGSAPAATVGDVAGPNGSRAIAVFSMCSDVGSIAGPLACGALASMVSYQAAFATGAILWLASALVASTISRHFGDGGGGGIG